MHIAKIVLVGVLAALLVAALVLYWEYVFLGFCVLLVALMMIGLANSQPASVSPEEQERRRRSFKNYQIAQDIAERREAHYAAMEQWRQQQQPPPRDPGTWGGGDGGRFC